MRTRHHTVKSKISREDAIAFLAQYPACGMRPDGQAPVLSVCHHIGIRTPATYVDHVIPPRGNTMMAADREGNWQSLCDECYATKRITIK